MVMKTVMAIRAKRVMKDEEVVVVVVVVAHQIPYSL